MFLHFNNHRIEEKNIHETQNRKVKPNTFLLLGCAPYGIGRSPRGWWPARSIEAPSRGHQEVP